MLDFIDRFTDERFKNNKRLKVISVWIGTITNEKSLTRYISAGTPENGQFVRDLGENWFDHDFIAVNYQKRAEPIEQVVSALAQTLGCPQQMEQEMLARCLGQGVTQANTTVCLMQHVYKGEEDQDFNGLRFAGSYEYEEPEPEVRHKFDHIFAGVTTAAALPDLREYATEGTFSGETGLTSDDVQYYGYKLRDGTVLPVAEFFSLPIVNQRLVLDDSADAVFYACRNAGMENINAFISVSTDDATSLDIEAGKTFCGLRYLGVFKTQYPG